MGWNGNRIDRSQAGRFLAVLWFLAAALALQFVATAQGFSLRLAAQQSAGDFSSPQGDASDPSLSRYAVRGFPVADLRFMADRADGKASPGGTGPFVLPAPVFIPAVALGGEAVGEISSTSTIAARGDIVRVRGPPAVLA